MGDPVDVFIPQHGSLATHLVEQAAVVGRVGGEARLGSRYSQLPTITFVVFLRLERCTGMFREQPISSNICMQV